MNLRCSQAVTIAVSIALPMATGFGPICTAQAAPIGPPAGRLELAAGVHDRVVPDSVAADRSSWRAAGEPIDQAPALVMPTDEIVRWGRCPPWPQGPVVLLADGGVIAGRIATLGDETCVVESASLGRLELPAAAIRGYRASLATGPVAVAAGSASAAEQRGVVLLANGDRLAAARIGWQADTLVVEAGRGPVAIGADVVRALDRGSSDVILANARPTRRIDVAITDGSRFSITGLRAAETADPSGARTTLSLRLVDGSGRPIEADCATDEIAALTVDGGCAEFLAPKEPSAYEHAPALGAAWPLVRGHAATGDWPGLRGETAFTAVGLHAPARIRYRLDRPANRFESVVGVEDSAGQGGSVIVRVVAGSGTGPPREVFVSSVLRGGDPPVAIRAELSAATWIELAVDPTDDGEVLDRTLWLDPRVVGPPADP